MKTNSKLGAWALILCLWPMMVPATACNQNTIAALTNTLGNAAASIATAEGNTALATQLKTDTAAAVTAITNWKSGTPAQDAIAALNIVISDLNLICPSTGVCGPYAPLIALALGTAQSILAILNPATSAEKVGVHGEVAHVNLGYYPKDAKDFTAQWNGICASTPGLAQAAIK